MEGEREVIEAQIHEALVAGDRSRAATLTVEAYGGEVLAFIEDRVKSGGDAEEVFSDLLEELWESLERFRGDCSMRTWCYLLARRGVGKQWRGLGVRRKRELSSGNFSALEEVARSRTAPFLRTEVKSRARELRETLPEEEQQLLLLRIERDLPFADIARIMSDDESLSAEALSREASRLRKRFQLAKDRLTTLLVSEGLVPSE